MNAKPKVIHYMPKSNAFFAICGEDCPERSTVKRAKVTCKRCLRVMAAKGKARG
jgi:hypothetical protein